MTKETGIIDWRIGALLEVKLIHALIMGKNNIVKSTWPNWCRKNLPTKLAYVLCFFFISVLWTKNSYSTLKCSRSGDFEVCIDEAAIPNRIFNRDRFFESIFDITGIDENNARKSDRFGGEFKKLESRWINIFEKVREAEHKDFSSFFIGNVFSTTYNFEKPLFKYQLDGDKESFSIDMDTIQNEHSQHIHSNPLYSNLTKKQKDEIIIKETEEINRGFLSILVPELRQSVYLHLANKVFLDFVHSNLTILIRPDNGILPSKRIFVSSLGELSVPEDIHAQLDDGEIALALVHEAYHVQYSSIVFITAMTKWLEGAQESMSVIAGDNPLFSSQLDRLFTGPFKELYIEHLRGWMGFLNESEMQFLEPFIDAKVLTNLYPDEEKARKYLSIIVNSENKNTARVKLLRLMVDCFLFEPCLKTLTVALRATYQDYFGISVNPVVSRWESCVANETFTEREQEILEGLNSEFVSYLDVYLSPLFQSVSLSDLKLNTKTDLRPVSYQLTNGFVIHILSLLTDHRKSTHC